MREAFVSAKVHKENMVFVIQKPSDTVPLVLQGFMQKYNGPIDSRLIFRQMVFDVANETQLPLEYTEYKEIIPETKTTVLVTLKKLYWFASPASFKLSAYFDFELPSTGRTYTIVGEQISVLIAESDRATKKAFEDAMYQFLQLREKELTDLEK